jgi:hypothetical protein
MFDIRVSVRQLYIPDSFRRCTAGKPRPAVTFNRQMESLDQGRRNTERTLQYGNGWRCRNDGEGNAGKQSRENLLTSWYMERPAGGTRWSGDSSVNEPEQLLLDRAWHDAVQTPASSYVACVSDVLKKIDSYWRQAADS